MVMELSFRVLRSSSGSSSSVFLPFFNPGVPCKKASFFEGILKISVVLKQGFCNPVADGNGLSRDASTMNIDGHIELISGSRYIKGLKSNHLAGLSPEILFQCPLVDHKLSFSGFKPNPCNGGFSFAGSINWFCHFLLSLSKNS